MTDPLSRQLELSVAALEVLVSVSRRTLYQRSAGSMFVSRHAMERLRLAYEALYPGLLDDTFTRIEQGKI